MEEETSLKDEVKKLNENFNNLLASGKVKGFKLKKEPSKAQVNKNFVQVLYIQENRILKPMKVPIEEGTISIEGAPRLATSDYMLNYNGKPTIILDSLSSEPYNPRVNLEQTVRDKMLAAGYRLLANRVELGQVKGKKKMSGVVIFLIIAAILVGGYFLLK